MSRFRCFTLWIAFLSTITCPISQAAEFNPWEGPKPLLVLVQTDGWGSGENPIITVYEDGTFLFQKTVGKQKTYFTSILSTEQLIYFIKRTKPLLALKDLKPFYDIVQVSDQPSSLFYIKEGKRELAVEAYGMEIDPSDRIPPNLFRKRVDTLPAELTEFHQFLTTLKIPDGKEYVPKYMEIVTYPSESTNSPEAWPKEWPGFGTPHGIQKKNSYSIFMEGSKVEEIRDFFKKTESGRVYLIDGKKYGAYYRHVFPSEPIWQNVFSSINRKAVQTK